MLPNVASSQMPAGWYGFTGGPPIVGVISPLAARARDAVCRRRWLTVRPRPAGATGSTTGLHEDVFITGLGTIVRNGSARIVSELKAITCTAYIADKFGTMRCGGASTNPGAPCTSDATCTNGGTGSCRATPDSLLELKLISKKQRGE